MALPIGLGLGLMGGSLLGKLYSQFNPTARKYKKLQDRHEKARAQAALEDVQAQEEEMREEHPREQALMRQSLAARRFGKSRDPMDIGNQQIGRLTRAQARQAAALGRSKADAQRGLSLIKQRRKYEKRMMPLNILGMAQESFGQMGSFFK